MLSTFLGFVFGKNRTQTEHNPSTYPCHTLNNRVLLRQDHMDMLQRKLRMLYEDTIPEGDTIGVPSIFDEDYKRRIWYLCHLPVEDLLELLELDRLDQVVGHHIKGFGSFQVPRVYGAAHHVEGDLFVEVVLDLYEFAQKFPAIHHGHVQVEEDDVRETIFGKVLEYGLEIVQGLLAILKDDKVLGQLLDLDDLLDKIYVYFIIVNDTSQFDRFHRTPEFDFKRRANVDSAGNRYFPAHGLYLVLGDEQADPLGFGMTVEGLVHAEHFVAILGKIYPHAVVTDLQKAVSALPVGLDIDHRFSSRLLISDGICDQI